MRRSALIFCASGVLMLAACSGIPPLASHSREPPHIESIEPSSATFGDQIVIRGSGFDRESNTIGFGPLADGSDAYMNGVPSPDAKTLRFELPGTMGVCGPAYPVADEPEPCIAIGVTLPLGDLDVSVSSEHGISNAQTFTRLETPMERARRVTNESPVLQTLMADLEAAVAASRGQGTIPGVFYRIDYVESESGEVYVELSVKGLTAEELVVPNEIEGYDVRVDAQYPIISSD